MEHWEHEKFGLILSKVHNTIVEKGFQLSYVHAEKECVGLEYSRFNKILLFQLAPTSDIILKKGFLKKRIWSLKDELNYELIYEYAEFIDEGIDYLIKNKLI